MFVAGVVASGESYPDAIRRELKEELGVVDVEPTFLFKLRTIRAKGNGVKTP